MTQTTPRLAMKLWRSTASILRGMKESRYCPMLLAMSLSAMLPITLLLVLGLHLVVIILSSILDSSRNCWERRTLMRDSKGAPWILQAFLSSCIMRGLYLVILVVWRTRLSTLSFQQRVNIRLSLILETQLSCIINFLER